MQRKETGNSGKGFPHPRTAGEVLGWCRENGIIPLPCRPRTKGPLGCISTRGVYGTSPPDSRCLLVDYGRWMFGTAVKDSFHIPTPERIAVIERFWSSPGMKDLGPDAIAISIDMNYPAGDGFSVACIDIDDDAYTDLIDLPFLKDAPVIRGKKGAKLLFKLDRQNAVPRPILQYTTAGNLRRPGKEQAPPLIELFTGHKHALIFGEHPDSTLSSPVNYLFLRQFGHPVPVIKWWDLITGLEGYARSRGLVARKEDGVIPVDQTSLSIWKNGRGTTGVAKEDGGRNHPLGQTRLDFFPERAP